MKPFTRKISQPMRAGVFNFMKVVAIVIQFFQKAFQVFYKERFFFTTAYTGIYKAYYNENVHHTFQNRFTLNLYTFRFRKYEWVVWS